MTTYPVAGWTGPSAPCNWHVRVYQAGCVPKSGYGALGQLCDGFHGHAVAMYASAAKRFIGALGNTVSRGQM